MQDLGGVLQTALKLMLELDDSLLEIIVLSLRVSLTATLLAAVVGFVLGAMLAVWRFPGRGAILVLLNSLMGLPPVVVGLMVYLLLSRSGPLGGFGLLFSESAMIIAQWLLVTPLIAALTRQIVADLMLEYREQLLSLGSSRWTMLQTLLWEGRFSLLTVMLAGFGRAISEVGAVLIVGGNIMHHTRVMTTAIALETSKGNLTIALALGMVLITLACMVNAAVAFCKAYAERLYG